MNHQTLPAKPEDITPAWLTETLRQAGVIDASVVTDIIAEPMAVGVGFGGSLARLTVSYDQPANAGSRTIVAKYPTSHGPTRSLINDMGYYESEVRFYQEMAQGNSIRTPQCYFAAFNPADGNFLLLLEDLSHLRTQDQLAGCSLEDVETVIKALGQFHARNWNISANSGLEWAPPFGARAEWAQSIFPRAWGAFQRKAPEIIPESLMTLASLITPHVAGIILRLAEPPITVRHGDVRLDNLFFDSSGDDAGVVAIDWQLVGACRGTYDFAYFAGMSLTTEMRKQHLDELLGLYQETLSESGVSGYTLNDCFEDYGYTLLYLILFLAVAGSTLEMESTRGQLLAQALTERLADALTEIDAPALLAKLD